MKAKLNNDQAWLLETAKAIADRLKVWREGTQLRIHIPSRIKITTTDTDGRCVVIGNLGKNQPCVSIWFDRFTRYTEPKLYACFWSRDAKQIQMLSRKVVSKHLWQVRTLTDADVVRTEFCMMKEKLGRDEFNRPVLENYDSEKEYFFGFYYLTVGSRAQINLHFCELAVDFIREVVRSLTGAREDNFQPEDYACWENRKLVQSHMRRERSSFLAAQCKERDNYRCQVCDMSFAGVYGDKLGALFAEAHHIMPLGGQGDKVRTMIDDLITVCANCHRMLDRMTGKRDDIKKLRAAVRKRQANRT